SRTVLRLVCECKRSRDANWIFLIERDCQTVDRACVHWTRFHERHSADSGWNDFALTTSSYESSFCIVRGKGENDTPLLERLARRVIFATEALAHEESDLVWRDDEHDWRLYLPVIITTAKLWACRYAPERIELATGIVSDATFEEVSAIRFRKAFTTVHEAKSEASLRRLNEIQERSVL